MLTQHNYEVLQPEIGQGTKLFDCCRKEPPPDDSKCSDCCYDTWQDELKEVSSRYHQEVENALQLQKQLSVVTDRRNRFRKWVDELNDAEEMARAICFQLDVIATQSDKIWFNACKTTEAVEILFCMLRDFYYQVDQIRIRYDSLQNCINSNSDPALVKDKGILQCLSEYYKKLEEVIKTRDELIRLVVEAIRLSQLIRNNISTRNCPEGDDHYDPCDPNKKACDCSDKNVYYGFKTIICEWYCAFNCWEDCKPCKDNDEPKSGHQHQQGAPAPASDDPCAGEICRLKPTFEFPICNDIYLEKIKNMRDKDEKCVKSLSEKVNDANKRKEALAACKQSLESAIKEVNPKDRCK